MDDNTVLTVMKDGVYIAQLSWATYRRVHGNALSESQVADLRERLQRQGQASQPTPSGLHTLRLVQHCRS